jgi:carboxypeptidase PM20D1
MAGNGRADLVDADFALNSDGGGGELDEVGSPTTFWVQTSEERYHTFKLSTSNSGGHSSRPRPDNAIYELARAVAESMDEAAVQRLSQQPFYNAILRTTCTATELKGGHAENALPRQASATVNCRILPAKSPQEV